MPLGRSTDRAQHTSRRSAKNRRIGYFVGDVFQLGDLRRTIIITFMVNDATSTWGGGTARQAARIFPSAQREFCRIVSDDPDALVLGAVTLIAVGKRTYLAPLVAQRGYGRSAVPRIRYKALRTAMTRLASLATQLRAIVRMPRLGCGGAGGRWERVAAVVERVVVPRTEVQVFDIVARRRRSEPARSDAAE